MAKNIKQMAADFKRQGFDMDRQINKIARGFAKGYVDAAIDAMLRASASVGRDPHAGQGCQQILDRSAGVVQVAPGIAQGHAAGGVVENTYDENDNRITVMFGSDWAEKHPLTLFDLRQEVKTLAPIGINLRIQLRPA